MSKEDEIFKNVFSYIGDNLTEKLTVEEIAKHVYLSPTYLQSVFKENYGVPLAEYVRRQKLQKARELLCSKEGLKHRGQRCIEPEAVFEQMKYNMNYKRFRHFGKDKVFMDFTFSAIAKWLKKV